MATSSRTRPARRFAVRAALVLLAIGVTVHAFVVQTIDGELQRQLDLHGEFVTEYLLAPALRAGATPDAAAAAVVADDPQVTRVTLRDPDAAIVGRAGDRAETDVTSRVPVPGTDLVATIDQDDTVVQAAATDLTRRMALVLGGGLLVLWLAIVPLAYRLGRELRAQADELREQSRELQRLLDQEHLTVARLREADQLRDQFLESVSHELRTPLTVVLGSLQMLDAKGDDLPGPLRHQLVERAHEKAQRLSALVQALLDLNASAEAPQHLRWVDLARAVELARQAIGDLDVELDLEVEGLVTDRGQLVRSLGALLGNVARHAPDGGPAVVRAHQRGDDVELVVEDRGPGIPVSLREVVFEPFRHGELQDAHSPGTGIGLALVAAHAGQHDGRAWVTERPGGGTRVHVLLRDVVGERPADADEEPPLDGEARGVVTPVVSDQSPPRAERRTPTADADASPSEEDTTVDGPAATQPPAETPPRKVVRRVVRRVPRTAPED